MLTLLFVYSTIPDPRRGGVERMMDILAKGLICRGYKVIYLIHNKGVGVGSYDCPAPLYFYPKDQSNTEKNHSFYKAFIEEYKIDLVINHCANFTGYKEYQVPCLDNVKDISVIHSNPMLNYEHLASEELVIKERTTIGFLKLIGRVLLYPRIKRIYLKSRRDHFRYLSEHSDTIVLLSSSHEDVLKKFKITYDEEKIEVIPNPMSFDIQRCNNKKRQLLYVGRLEQGEKRPDRLIKIWKRLYRKFPDWEMIIVGDGKERGRLEHQAKKLERISFVGFQSPEQYYRDASIFCMTSNFEGFGMVLTEAMAFGTVPFAFDSYSAVHDIIEDGKTGVLVKPFSIKEYADKLATLMDNEAQRIQMSENCMKDVVRFSLDNIIKLWEILFNSLGK